MTISTLSRISTLSTVGVTWLALSNDSTCHHELVSHNRGHQTLQLHRYLVITTQYLHNIYTISSQYLHNINAASGRPRLESTSARPVTSSTGSAEPVLEAAPEVGLATRCRTGRRATGARCRWRGGDLSTGTPSTSSSTQVNTNTSS